MSLIPDRDGSNVIAILVVCIIFWILAVIAVGLRIWSRSIKKTGLRVNDHAMFIALASFLLALELISFNLVIVLGDLLQCNGHDMYITYDRLQKFLPNL